MSSWTIAAAAAVRYGIPMVAPADAALRFGADLDTAVGFSLGPGPTSAAITKAGLGPDEARARLEEALAPYLGPDGVRIPGAHWLVTAEATR